MFRAGDLLILPGSQSSTDRPTYVTPSDGVSPALTAFGGIGSPRLMCNHLGTPVQHKISAFSNPLHVPSAWCRNRSIFLITWWSAVMPALVTVIFPACPLTRPTQLSPSPGNS